MTTVLYVLGVLAIALGIGLSIALHEIGHLVPAKRFGVKVTQYMVGFGPTVWSRRRGDTEYGVKAIPLGGYVRMIGMYPPGPGDEPGALRAGTTSRMGTLIDQARQESMQEVQPGDENRVFYKLSAPKKIVTMLGGPFMNLAIAAGLLAVTIAGVGVPTLVPTVSQVAQCVPSTPPTAAKPNPDCLPGDPASPALLAGFQTGDTITAVGGNPVRTWAEATAAIRAAKGTELAFTVDRGGTELTLTAPIAVLQRAAYTQTGPELDADGALVTESVGYLGASGTTGFVRQPLSAVPGTLGELLAQTGRVLVTVPEKMVGVVKAVAGQGERDPNGPISVVGVGRAGGEVASGQVALGDGSPRSTAYLLLSLLIGLNIALFIFNLIPLLPLDGGHVLGAVWEGLKRAVARVTGRPDPGYVDVAKGLPIAYAVSTLLIVMSVLLIYADLVTPIKLAG